MVTSAPVPPRVRVMIAMSPTLSRRRRSSEPGATFPPRRAFVSYFSERTVVLALVTDIRCAERSAPAVRIAHLDARPRLGLRDTDHPGRLPLPDERLALGCPDLDRVGAPVIDPEDRAVGAAGVGDRCPFRLAAGAVPQPQRDACLAQAVVDRQRVDRGG